MKKNETEQKSWSQCITLIAIIALFFILMYQSPFRLDDLAWGSERGIERLQRGFRGYNGRYIGNLIVIILTRFPAGLRVLMEMAILVGGIWNVWILLKRNNDILMLFLALLLAAPPAIFNQTILWVSGFSNFVVSAVFVFYIFRICMEMLEGTVDISFKTGVVHVLLIFMGQMILETGSIYTIILLFFTGICILVQKKKVPIYLSAYFIGACAGAAVMFSNSSYRAAVLGNGDTYKKISISGDFFQLINTWWTKYTTQIFPNWIQNIPLINLLLILCIVILCFWSASRFSGMIQMLGAFFAAWIVFNIQKPDWNSLIPYGVYLNAIVGIVWMIYVLVSIMMLNIEYTEKRLLLFAAGSQIFMVSPLIVADPLTDRCFFQNYVFWVLLICMLLRLCLLKLADIKISRKIKRFMKLMPNCFVIGTLFMLVASQFMSWRVADIRKAEIEKCLEENADSIILPYNPSESTYCYGDNIANDNRSWIYKYKMYYDIPREVNLTFVDYNTYVTMKEQKK